jgi:hypothetical protein
LKLYKTRDFAKLIRKSDIDDETLRDAVARAAKGLVDAELGSGLIKQRVARKGQGRSGGYRTIIALRVGERAVFLHCFAKNEAANIDPVELRALRALASSFLAASAAQIETLVKAGELTEVKS